MSAASGPFRFSVRSGFTLVELLVAMAVLVLLVGMLGQVVTLTTEVISADAKNLDASSQARFAFDRIALDLAARPRRPELGMTFTIAPGNDSFQFYSQVNGYSGAREIATIGYRIQQGTPNRLYQMERGAVGADWGAILPQIPAAPANPNPETPDPNYEVLASEVFRLEVRFFLNDGTFSSTNGSPLAGAAGAQDFSNVKGLIVGLGVLDDKSRKLISDSQLQTLAGDLPDPADTQDPLSKWNGAIAATGFGAGIPPKAVQSVRVYQRIFYVP